MTLRARAVRALGGVTLLVATVGLLALAGEIALRLFPGAGRGGAERRFDPYRPDGVLGYALRPGADTVHEEEDFSVRVRVNALGQRGPGRTAEKPPGVRRILLLGDSFAFGFGVAEEETFGAVLERLLTARGESVEVLSAAVPGWSADNDLVYLRSRGFALRPDLVLLAVCENDLSDLAWNRVTLDDERLPVRIEATRRMIDHHGRMRYVNPGRTAEPAWNVPGQRFLEDHSRLYHWLRLRLTKLEAAWATRRAGSAGPPWLREDPPRPIDALSPDEVQSALATSPEFRLRYHRHLVAAMARECAARGIAFRLLLVALRSDAREHEPTIEALHVDCAADGIPCLDTAEILPDRGRDPAFFFAHDSHWNAQGHARVGEALARWLGEGAS